MSETAMDQERLATLLYGLGADPKVLTKNAVNVRCPFCDDAGTHLGVFVSNLRYHCWKCKRTGTLRRLLVAYGIEWNDAEKVLRAVEADAVRDLTMPDRIRRILQPITSAPNPPSPTVAMPWCEDLSDDLLASQPTLRWFLDKRNIPVSVCRDHDAGWAGVQGRYAYRLLLPVYDQHGRVAAFQARDVTTGGAGPKYLTEGRVGELLYWTDRIDEGKNPRRLYVVEGVFDAWRMGCNAVATFTHGLSGAQRQQLLADPDVDEIVLAWDGDSYDLSVAAARGLAPLVRAGAVRLPDGADPDRMGGDAVRALEVAWA